MLECIELRFHLATIGSMRKKEKNTKATAPTDRHKPARMVRLPVRLVRQLEILAEKNLTNVTQETVRLLREGLKREELWPPSD